MAFSFISFEESDPAGRPSRANSAVFFMVCMLPCLLTVLFGAVDSITWAAIMVVTAAMIVLWSLQGWFENGLLFDPNSLLLPIVVLIALGIFQLLPLGTDLPAGMLTTPPARSASLYPYATRAFIRNLAVFVVFLSAALTFVNSTTRVQKAALVVVIFGSLMGFYGILQQIAQPDGIYGMRRSAQGNPFGSFVNQHHFAAFMEMTAGVTMGFIFGSSAKEKKFLFGLALVVMLAAIVLTGSRGGMLSICGTSGFAALLSFVYRRRYDAKAAVPPERRSKLPVLAGGFAMAAAVVFLVLYLGGDDALGRGVGLGGSADDASSGRLHFWSIALKIFFDHPIIGAGLDAFGVAFTRYDTWNGAFRVEQAHNDYLQMLADGGIIGLICGSGCIFLLFKKGLRTISSSAVGLRRDIAIGSLAGCFGILIHSFVDFPLRTWSNSFFFLLLTALATVSVRSGEEVTRRRKRKTT